MSPKKPPQAAQMGPRETKGVIMGPQPWGPKLWRPRRRYEGVNWHLQLIVKIITLLNENSSCLYDGRTSLWSSGGVWGPRGQNYSHSDMKVFRNFHSLISCVGGGKRFPHPSSGPWLDLKIKPTKTDEQEKSVPILLIFPCTREPSQENEDPMKWPEQAPFIVLDKETINMWRMDKIKKLGVGVAMVKWRAQSEFNKVCWQIPLERLRTDRRLSPVRGHVFPAFGQKRESFFCIYCF